MVVKVPQELKSVLGSEGLAFFDDDLFEKGDIFEQVVEDSFVEGVEEDRGEFLNLMGILDEL